MQVTTNQPKRRRFERPLPFSSCLPNKKLLNNGVTLILFAVI